MSKRPPFAVPPIPAKKRFSEPEATEIAAIIRQIGAHLERLMKMAMEHGHLVDELRLGNIAAEIRRLTTYQECVKIVEAIKAP